MSTIGAQVVSNAKPRPVEYFIILEDNLLIVGELQSGTQWKALSFGLVVALKKAGL